MIDNKGYSEGYDPFTVLIYYRICKSCFYDDKTKKTGKDLLDHKLAFIDNFYEKFKSQPEVDLDMLNTLVKYYKEEAYEEFGKELKSQQMSQYLTEDIYRQYLNKRVV